MRLVDDDRDESGCEMRFSKQLFEAASFLHELLRARNYNTVRPVLNVLLVLSQAQRSYEDFHLENPRRLRDRVHVNIDGLDSNLTEIISMLVAKKGERRDDNQDSRWFCEQRDPETQSFPHSAPSLKQNMVFSLEQSLCELQLEVTRIFTKLFEG